MSTQLVERPSSLFSHHTPYSLNEHSMSLPHSTNPFRYDPTNSEQTQSLFSSGHHQSFSTSYTPSSRMRTAADSNSSKQSSSGGTMGMLNTNMSSEDSGSGVIKRTNKTHVPSACINCKKAHLACDVSRPCKRCVALGKVDTCVDIKHKKRGRPKLKDKKPYPYDTHATADAKTWGTNPQFLPPTTTDPDQQSSGHHHVDQPPPPPQNQQLSFSSSSFIPSPPHHHSPPVRSRPTPFQRTPFLEKSSKFVNQPIMGSSRSPSMSSLSENPSPAITMFLTVDGAACAYVSQECLGTTGYYPLELVHKSIYEYIPPNDAEKFQKLVGSLLESARQYSNSTNHNQYSYQPVTTSDPRFSQISPEHLKYHIPGGTKVSEMINLRQRIGQYDLYNVQMYLGGGLGADLARKETWGSLYIVAFFTKIKSDTCLPPNDPYVRPPAVDPTMNLGMGRSGSGLLSPVLSPRQSSFSESAPHPPLYVEAPQPPPPNPHNPNDHFNLPHHHLPDNYQQHNNFSPIIPRSNPMTPSVRRPEPLVNPLINGSPSRRPDTSPSLLADRRPSAFNPTRSPVSTTAYLNESEESKPKVDASYIHHDRPASYHHHHHHHNHHSNNGIPSSCDECDESLISSMISRESGSRGENLGVSDSASTKRMSVNSLLC